MANRLRNPEWRGDRVRDLYEIELLWEFVIQGKPVLGICRGCQLINVASDRHRPFRAEDLLEESQFGLLERGKLFKPACRTGQF